MTHEEICSLFKAWQSSRWDMEVKARILDKAMDDGCSKATAWPYELVDEFDSICQLCASRYEELVAALRATRSS
ncbi:MAG: hypothetical protein ACXWC6_13335 [Ramlibacter sp.]